MTRTREWLLYNAVEAWLVNYGKQPSETVEQYKELREELRTKFMASLELRDAPTKPTTPRKRSNAKPPTKTV